MWWLLRLLRGRWLLEVPKPPYPINDNPLLNVINEERSKYRLNPLKLSECLESQAKRHVEWMITNRLSHTGFDSRLLACNFKSGSENIAYGQKTPKEVVSDWMTSNGHRRNILGQWKEFGGAGQNNYWCAIFGQ